MHLFFCFYFSSCFIRIYRNRMCSLFIYFRTAWVFFFLVVVLIIRDAFFFFLGFYGSSVPYFNIYTYIYIYIYMYMSFFFFRSKMSTGRLFFLVFFFFFIPLLFQCYHHSSSTVADFNPSPLTPNPLFFLSPPSKKKKGEL